MGIFDGILIMSDIDGTFEMNEYRCPSANVEAIRYFTKNGGRFAFATGRMSDYLIARGFTDFVNAPCCQCNGGYVYDYEKELVLYTRKLPLTVNELAEIVLPYRKLIKKFMAPVRNETEAHKPLDLDNLPHDIKCIRPVKQITVLESANDTDWILQKLQSDKRLQGCYICKSWETGIEILDKNATKGNAIDYIKEYCGCHTSVAIGDYGNDLPMIQRADIGVAVGDAIDELKAAADMVVCDCKENAIADLIYKLEEKITKR